MKTCIFLLFLALSTAFAQAQPIITRAEAQDDLDSLYAFIRNAHPDMFAVRSESDFENDYIDMYNELPDSLRVTEFYRVVAPLVASLCDGHTWCRIDPAKMPDMKVLPLKVTIDPERKVPLVVTDLSVTDKPIPYGADIARINEQYTQPMVEDMLGCTSGERELFRMQVVGDEFSWLLYAFDPSSTYRLDYNVLGKDFAASLEAIPYDEYKKRLAAAEPEAAENYVFKVLPGKIGMITMNSFSHSDKFKAFLDSTFTIVQDRALTDLVIDIRQNGGGNSSLGDELFQYISPVPFAQYGTMHVNHTSYTSTGTGRPLKPDEKPGVKIYEQDETLPPLRDNPLRFKGKLYLLTSPYTFSSASKFAWAFQYFNMGEVIGEETGGLIVSFGDTIYRYLPNSRLMVGSSFKKFYGYGATDEHTHGVKPDTGMPAGEALEYTLDKIRNSR